MRALRTWIEIDKKALHYNVRRFLHLIPANTQLMAVVKSNAYGHGLTLVVRILSELKPNPYNLEPNLWFGVDSITEGLKLREEKITHPVLILGHTIPVLFKEALNKNLIVSIADFYSLSKLSWPKNKPKFFIKIDSGMHRRGFLPEDIERLLSFLHQKNLKPLGIFSHFASASDVTHRLDSQKQIETFENTSEQFKKAGFGSLIKSLSATGGTLFYPEVRFNMIRIGMGIYGYYPSLDKQTTLKTAPKLKPVLTWKTIVSEIKEIPAGSLVGYNLTHKVKKRARIAILPIGYWHGYDRRLSNRGEVLIHGHRAPVIGLVSMDMVVVDVTGIDKIKTGDEVALIGRQGKEAIWADELSRKASMSHYEFLTRLNPLIKRIEVT